MKKEPLKFFRVFCYALPLWVVQLPINSYVVYRKSVADAICYGLEKETRFVTLHGSSDNTRWQSIPRDYSIELPF